MGNKVILILCYLDTFGDTPNGISNRTSSGTGVAFKNITWQASGLVSWNIKPVNH